MKFEVEIGNKIIEYNVQYGKTKKISIHIDSLGLITVKVPKDTSKEIIISAVEQHGKWILEKTSNIADAREIPKKREYQDKGKFLYLGKEYFLHELIETNGLNEENLKKNLKKFYFSSCEKIVRERIHIYQIQLRVKPKTIEVVESKTKWGKL